MGRGARQDTDCVTCGTERDERQRVLADHRQLIFGQRQPVNDVLYEVVGDDRRHVPPQFPQYHQFPILQKTIREERNLTIYFASGLKAAAASGDDSWQMGEETQCYQHRTRLHLQISLYCIQGQ